MGKYNLILVLFLILLISSTSVYAGFFDWLRKPQNKQVTKETIENEKQTSSTPKQQSNIEQNAQKGREWEIKAEKIICSQKKCIYNINGATKNMNKWIQSNTFTIVGGKTTKEFINKNNLFGNNFFSKEPDFLEITQNFGKITKIKIIDAKTSADAPRPSQEIAFKELCKIAIVPCEVEYAVPKKEASVGDLCIFAFGNVVPDPVDVLCLLAVFSK